MMLFALLVGVVGLLIGSFLNVVIYRVPLGKSIVAPPSACPRCGEHIRAYDNVPVVSWLLLRGKCRQCGAGISARYPLVELGTAVLFFVVTLYFGRDIFAQSTAPGIASAALVLVAYLYLAAISVALTMIDIDVRKLPNAIVLPSYVVPLVLFGLSSVFSGDYSGLIRAAIAMAVLAVAYFAMAFAYPAGMGLGDVKLAGVIGIYLGWVGWGALAVGAMAAFLLGGLYALVLIVAKRANRKSGVPFGPWMLGGAWLGIGAGSVLFAGYLSLFGLSAA